VADCQTKHDKRNQPLGLVYCWIVVRQGTGVSREQVLFTYRSAGYSGATRTVPAMDLGRFSHTRAERQYSGSCQVNKRLKMRFESILMDW